MNRISPPTPPIPSINKYIPFSRHLAVLSLLELIVLVLAWKVAGWWGLDRWSSSTWSVTLHGKRGDMRCGLA